MRKTLIPLTMAGLLIFQNFAWAQSRIDNIGTKEIAEAQTEMAQVHDRIVILEQALAQAEEDLRGTKDLKGQIRSTSVAILGAALGFYAAWILVLQNPLPYQKQLRSGRVIGVTAAAVAILSTLCNHLFSKSLPPSGEISKATIGLDKTHIELLAELQTATDPDEIRLINDLIQNISLSRKALATYSQQQSTETATGVALQTLQLAGLVFAVFAGTDTAKFTRLPKTVYYASSLTLINTNIASLAMPYGSHQDINQLLDQIERTRQLLKALE